MRAYDEGFLPEDEQEVENLRLAGYTKCYNQLCPFQIQPEVAEVSGDSFTCPVCRRTYNLLAHVGRHPNAFTPGGITIAGIALGEQAQIAEDLVREMGSIPGYGSIVWWHEGPAVGELGKSPLDGATTEWGVEVKAVNADAQNLRFIPGRPAERAAKRQMAADMGLRGVLGLLVLLNYRTSLADIYAMEMPNDPWQTQGGRQVQGPVAFRHHNGTHLVAELTFDNPLMDPTKATPIVAQPSVATITDDIPF